MSNKALKAFMNEHFYFSGLKKDGVFPKEMKFNDYEGQAKIICKMLGLESIYDYGKYEISGHISYAGERPMHLNDKGELKTVPFVETFFPNSLHITGPAESK